MHALRFVLFALASAACALPVGASDSAASSPAIGPTSMPLASDGLAIDIEHGERRSVIDGVGWVVGLPKKLLLWDRRVDNHQVSPTTVDETADFLATNEVDGVMIRVNQYDPLGEWKRLTENDRVGLGWRATVGTLYTLGYSLVPGRLVGGDWYNPFTDTVHVYSDVPALAMEQAAQAADTHERSHPGFYSAVRLIPFVGLVHETRSKQAVFDYVDENGSAADRAEARKVLHPQLGAEVGGQAMVFVPQGDALLQIGGAAIGHAVGRYKAAQISETTTTPATASGPVAEPNGLIEPNGLSAPTGLRAPSEQVGPPEQAGPTLGE